MANEIEINVNFKCTNGFLKELFQSGRLQFDQTTAGIDKFVQNIGTSEETVSFSALTTEGYLVIVNLDDTNYVEWGPDSTGIIDIGKLEPGEIALFRLAPAATLKAQANTAACDVLFICLED